MLAALLSNIGVVSVNVRIIHATVWYLLLELSTVTGIMKLPFRMIDVSYGAFGVPTTPSPAVQR